MNKELTEEEINKIIAEFHYDNGEDSEIVNIFYEYTESLDALVPVWGKLRKEFNLCLKLNTHDLLYKDETGLSVDMWIKNILIVEASENLNDTSIQLAAAKATAICILELKGDE